MTQHYRITSSSDSVNDQFVAMLEQMTTLRREADGDCGTVAAESIYELLPFYGTGQIKIYRLMDNLMLTIFDAAFNEDLTLSFQLSPHYFEIEYCVNGSIGIEERSGSTTLFSPNQLSISMSRETDGTLTHAAGQRYRCVSLSADKRSIHAYLGSSGIGLWDETMEMLEAQIRQRYFKGVSATPDIAKCFLQIFNCHLPGKAKALFFESKVMEILSQLISRELPEPSFGAGGHQQLDEFEYGQIKRIPQLLQERLFDLPTVGQLSRDLAINRNKLMRGFKIIYGDTIFVYHRKMCLRRAAVQLTHSNASILEIALDAGYSSASNFSSAFKREFGHTPLQHRADGSPLTETTKGTIAT